MAVSLLAMLAFFLLPADVCGVGMTSSFNPLEADLSRVVHN